MCIITMQRNKASFRSRDQLLCKFIGTKESVYIRKEFNSHKTGLEHQHGRRDVMRKRPIFTQLNKDYHWLILGHLALTKLSSVFFNKLANNFETAR